MDPLYVALAVMGIIALACLSVLSIYLITVLVRLRTVLTDVEQNVKDLATKAIPVFENLEVITEKVRAVTENIDEQVNLAKASIRSIKDMADNIVDFERRIQERLEEPVLETVTIFASFFKGVRTIVDRFRS